MSTILFTISDLEVSVAAAVIAGVGALRLVLIGLLIVYFRRDRARIEEMAEVTNATLRRELPGSISSTANSRCRN